MGIEKLSVPKDVGDFVDDDDDANVGSGALMQPTGAGSGLWRNAVSGETLVLPQVKGRFVCRCSLAVSKKMSPVKSKRMKGAPKPKQEVATVGFSVGSQHLCEAVTVKQNSGVAGVPLSMTGI